MIKDENGLRIWGGQDGRLLILAAGCALMLGWTIVAGSWLYSMLLVAMMMIPVAVRRPVEASLGIYAFLIPFDSIAVLGEGATGPTLNKFIGVAAAGILLLMGFIRQRLVRPPKAVVWWSVFVLWGTMTALWAVDLQIVLDRLPTAVSLLLLYAVAVSVRVSEKELSTIGTLAIIGGVVAAAYAGYKYNEGVFYQETVGRASLIAGEREADPNQFAVSLLLPLSLTIGRFLEARRWSERLFPLCAIPVIATGLFLSMSRGSLLAVLVIVLVYMYHARSKWQVCVPVALLTLVALVMPDQFFQRIEMPYEIASAGRIDIWRVGIRALRDYGIIGAGLSNYPVVYDQYAHGQHGYSRGAHNIYLGMWVELGLVGLTAMLGAILSQLRSVTTGRRQGNEKIDAFALAIECACYGVLVSGFFLDIVWRKSFWLLWILLTLGGARHSRSSPSVAS